MKAFLPYILITSVFAISCQNTDDFYGIPIPEQNVQIDLTLNNADLEQVISKSWGLNSSEEQQLKTLDILVFNSAQKLVSRTQLVNPTNLTNRIATKSGSNMSVYVVANASTTVIGNGTPNDALGMATTVSALEDIKVANLLVDVQNNKTLIMCGKAQNITINPEGQIVTNVPIKLDYVAAKVTVNVYSALPSGETFELTDWKLGDLARYSYIFPRSSDVVDYTNAADFATQTSTNTWDDGTITVGVTPIPVKTVTFYLFENRRGTTGNTNEKLKSGSTAPAKATRLIARGYHKTAAGATGIDINLMFGLNSINDYNIERTKEYIYNVKINGLNDYTVETRYTKANVGFQAEVVNPTLDAHYDFRPLRISAFTGASVVQILDEFGAPTTNSFWLKVSQKNITKFVNNAGTYVRPTYNPTTEMLQTTSITHTNPTSMDNQMVYLYADEFLTEGPARTAKIRVIYTPTGSTALTPTEITITQRSIQFAGNVGMREINSSSAITSADYKIGLEVIEEATISITPGNLANERTLTMQYGFNNLTMLTTNPYTVRNGYDNTLNLVFSNIATGTLRAPYGRTGSSTISYATYDPIYNTYSARYCFEKNRDTDGNGSITGSEIKWYLPSTEEQLLVYTGGGSWSSVITDRWTPSNIYNASSQYSNSQNMAAIFSSGITGTTGLSSASYVRCIRRVPI